MSTIIGVVHLRLHVPEANSLKDKRRIIKSFKERTRNRFNVSIAEVDGQDTHRRAVVAVTMVGNDRRYIEGVLQQILNVAAMHRDMLLLDQDMEWL
jgi:hypothetical protein